MTPKEQKLHQMHLDNLSLYDHLDSYELAGMCCFLEAAGEPPEGRIDQLTVVLNRARLQYRGKNIIDCICWPYQFSWTLDTDPEHEKSIQIVGNFDKAYRSSLALKQCTDLAKGMIEGSIPLDADLVEADCVEYMNPDVCPDEFKERLAGGMKVLKKTGKHVFLVDA